MSTRSRPPRPRAAAVLGTLLLTGSALLAGESAPVDPWIAASTPSLEHDKLARLAGGWRTTMRIWISPDTPPLEFELKATAAMALGGRYHTTRVFGMMHGLVFEEIAYLGFNNVDGRFTRTSAHSLATGLLHLTGRWVEPGRTIEFLGETINPATREPVPVRQRLTFLDIDTLLLEHFDRTPAGTEVKSMEQRFTRTAPRPRPPLNDNVTY